jgi:hypothetical protein
MKAAGKPAQEIASVAARFGIRDAASRPPDRSPVMNRQPSTMARGG